MSLAEKDRLCAQRARRRTFAIISHPDAGKTTLTEKLLLYGGAIELAGAVKARKQARSATSDWMELEKKRGISITSAALTFEYAGKVVNLLDTPGHQDFSEDTYRALCAADSAVMVIDAGHGIEAQTRKLFAVARQKGLPVLSFFNKMDMPARDPFDLMDELEKVLGITAVPVTWPLGSGRDFAGVYVRDAKQVHLFSRTEHGARMAPKEVMGPQDAAIAQLAGRDVYEAFLEGLELVEGALPRFDTGAFLRQEITPVFFGSAVTNFGVEHFLNTFVDLAPAPADLGDAFCGLVFKVQANMNSAHRDRIAFVRILSGRFERGMTVTHQRLNKSLKLNYPHQFFGQERTVIDEAYPGDIIGLVNPGQLAVGDVLFEGKMPDVPTLPRFMMEHFARVVLRDTGARKRFQAGMEQLAQEGVIRRFSEPAQSPEPIVGVVGALQLDVLKFRLQDEYNAPVDLELLPQHTAAYLLKGDPDKLHYFAKHVIDEEGRDLMLFRDDRSYDYALANVQGVELSRQA